MATEDHYKVLGVPKTASKYQIKESFRRLALKFHPDRHSDSTESAIKDATIRFKQISEAYEVLSDDRKRAEYNLRRSSGHSGFYGGSRRGGGDYAGSGHGSGSSHKYDYYKGGVRSSAAASDGGYGWVTRLEMAVRYMTTRAFLLNLAFAGILLGGSMMIDASRETLWKMNNSGKSFEEAMESIEKNKARKDKS